MQRILSSFLAFSLGLFLALPASAVAPSEFDSALLAADAAVAAGDYDKAQEILEGLVAGTAPDVLQAGDAYDLQAGDAPDYFWAAGSGLVSLHRLTGDFEAASRVTAELAAARPELAGLLAVWEGDTAVLQGDADLALSRYQSAVAAPQQVVGGREVGEIAWRQIARLHEAAGNAEAAAAAHREILRRSAELPDLSQEEETACFLQPANGFQRPLTVDHTGMTFMEEMFEEQFHTGLDLNGPGKCDADIGTPFGSVARGCVRDVVPAVPGYRLAATTVEHLYDGRTSYSQYDGADSAFLSVGMPVRKGTVIGRIGDPPGDACAHLHHEIREQDHPAPALADYVQLLPQVETGDWYDDPIAFDDAHQAYLSTRFLDEEAFHPRYEGPWYPITWAGYDDDHLWSWSTYPWELPNRATYVWTPDALGGTYAVWALVPWTRSDALGALYQVLDENENVIVERKVDQEPLNDTWVFVGKFQAFAQNQLLLRLTTPVYASGVPRRQTAIDAFMIHRTD